MTRGESTYHCGAVGYQLSLLAGAAPADPAPLGMHTASCEQARLNSWLGYFSAMSASDPTMPGAFGAPVVTPPFPSQAVALAREPRVPEDRPAIGSTPRASVSPSATPTSPATAPSAGSSFTDTTAQVWTDTLGRGALVDFDLGDGDLTQAKVAWAMRTVLANRAALGVDTTLPDAGIVSAYSNISDKDCFVYTHADHAAVANALRNTDFGVRLQSVATCRTDPGASATTAVPANVLHGAFPADGSVGAFAANYGWLETPQISPTNQSSLFMGVQSFDVRHQHLPSTRVSGGDRYGTAVAVARAGFPGTAPVVYVASGVNYPDALSAGAAAAAQGGPLLLTSPGGLPDVVSAEISRLHPGRIVVVGGVNAVSTTVSDALSGLAPTVVRLAGSDRYDTSRRVAQYAFGAGPVPIAYVASGSSFPDALSATGAAGSQGGPVLLTPGGDATGSTVTATLSALAPKRIAVVGGPNAIPSGLDAALQGIAPVRRLAGSDRFATNAAVAAYAFASAPTALIASGLNFPDALTGAAWGGTAHFPLLLTNGSCLVKPEADRLETLSVDATTIVGGTSVVSDNVGRGNAC